MLRKSKSIYNDLWIERSRSDFSTEPNSQVVAQHQRYWDTLSNAIENGEFSELMAYAKEAGRYQYASGIDLADAIRRTVDATNMIEIALLEANNNEMPSVDIVSEVADLRSMIVMAVAEGYKLALNDAAAQPTEVARSSERLRATLMRNRGKYVPLELKSGEEIGPLYDQGMRFYAVQSGKLRLYNLLPNGRTITLSILSADDVFFQWRAEHASLSCICAEAMQESSIIALSEKELLALLGAQPAVALDVVGNFARRLTESQVLIEELMNSSINSRLYRTLLDLAREFGRRDDVANSTLIDVSLTHQRLADMLGSNRVTVTRKLLELQKRGVIQARGSGSIAILDLDALNTLALNASE
jgi:CRP-like cAMP-binding protein